MHWVHSQVIVPETSPFFCSSEECTHAGVHRVSALCDCCVWVYLFQIGVSALHEFMKLPPKL